ncbi:unnamed protein product [Rhizophagus irregularis]|nr:unnamed protein product [Rhizophagus irregularis]
MDYPGQKNVVLDFYPIIFRKWLLGSLRRSNASHQTNNFNTSQQIINQTKIIDQMRDNYSFTEVFSKIITLFTQKSNNCKIFQNMLNMKFDDDKDKGEDLEDQASLEDNDDNVVVFADEDINRNWRRR